MGSYDSRRGIDRLREVRCCLVYAAVIGRRERVGNSERVSDLVSENSLKLIARRRGPADSDGSGRSKQRWIHQHR